MPVARVPRANRGKRSIPMPRLEEPWRSFRDVYPILRRRWTGLLARFDMPFSEFRVLERCARAPAMASEIAQAIGITPAGATDLIHRLEKRHLVARVRHPVDRRAVLIRLTSAGARRHRAVKATARAFVRELNAAMTPDELRALTVGLAGLTRVLRLGARRPAGEA